MFQFKYKVEKVKEKTTYGSVCIKNVVFEPKDIEDALPQLIFKDENLMHMFAESNLTNRKRVNIYRRFMPKRSMGNDVESFIKTCINKNKTFYSFLAEGILGLVFRDLYGYQLAKALIDIGETLTDTHTGVDACMYNLKENTIVLGEAKFYEDLNDGMKQIIEDFIKKDINNKLESLQTAAENCEEAYQIVIKNLDSDEYEELTVDEFVKQNIVFAGFVLHSSGNVKGYDKETFYDKYSVSAEKLKDNICKHLNVKSIKNNYEILLVHLPINDKKSLIMKMIETSREKLRTI